MEIRQKVVQALKDGEEKYRDLVENINDVLFSTDDRGTVTYISPVIESLSGFRPDEILGRPFSDFVDATDQSRLAEDFKIALGKKTAAGEYRFASKSGQIKWCRTSTRPIFASERAIGVQGVLADITKAKHLEAQLQRAQKMEALGTLAGGVAHDLNNILSGIVSYPELLMLDLPEDSPLRGPLATIKSSGDKAATIVEDLLTLARRGVAAMELLDLNRLIEDYLASPEFKALKKRHPNISIEKALQPDLFSLIGSRVHISKTLMNLVSNAAEAMPTGGRITIQATNHYADKPYSGFETVAEGEYVVLTVADNGMGIAEDDLTRIFEPFYTKKAMGHSGSGLGMAVVWGTVKDHGGFINVKSSQGAGACFDLLFPASRKYTPEPELATPMEDYLGRGESILVIDDVQQQREIAAKMLSRLGYSTVTAAGGEEAVAYLTDNKADLILLDMIMAPGIDGYETYRRIHEIRPGQKALIVSGFSETDQVRKTLALGALKYIKKPYSLETIGMAIRAALDQPGEQD
jgi:PAS domain S-box-containing protein